MASKEKVGVVGAGLMGREIALVFALGGHEVLLADRSQESLSEALSRLRTILERGVERGFFPPEQKDQALTRIKTTVDLHQFAACDFVTEAVFEDEKVKAAVFRDLDAICAPACVLAGITSTIPTGVWAS